MRDFASSASRAALLRFMSSVRSFTFMHERRRARSSSASCRATIRSLSSPIFGAPLPPNERTNESTNERSYNVHYAIVFVIVVDGSGLGPLSFRPRERGKVKTGNARRVAHFDRLSSVQFRVLPPPNARTRTATELGVRIALCPLARLSLARPVVCQRLLFIVISSSSSPPKLQLDLRERERD